MVISPTDGFENPAMPDWLFYNFRIAFQTRNKDFVKGYQKLWEDIRSEGLDTERTKNEGGSF